MSVAADTHSNMVSPYADFDVSTPFRYPATWHHSKSRGQVIGSDHGLKTSAGFGAAIFLGQK